MVHVNPLAVDLASLPVETGLNSKPVTFNTKIGMITQKVDIRMKSNRYLVVFSLAWFVERVGEVDGVWRGRLPG